MDINKIKLDNKFKLIEASAGTGKSFTLAHLVLRNVIEKKVKPEEILLLSFTKNTCNELKEKIYERFNNLKLFIQDKSVVKIDNTLLSWYNYYKDNNQDSNQILFEIDDFIQGIYKLNVTTFHGFCNKILQEYSIDIGSFQDPNIDNNIDYLYKDVIDDLWIDQYLKLEEELIFSINRKRINTNYENRINKLFFFKMLKAIDQENIYRLKINTNYENIEISNYLINYFQYHWSNFCIEWENNGYKLFESLKELGNVIKDNGFKSQIYSPNPRNKFIQINQWIHEINLKLSNQDILYLISYISKEDLLSKYFYNKSINKEIKKFNINFDLSKFKTLQDNIYKIKDGLYNEFIRIFIQLAYIKLNKIKNELSILNFNDLIKIVEKKYLESNNINDTSFSDIQNRFKCILIDEFQDTDNVQWNIIKKFFYNKNHFLVCVGDPKQAIYKFRGGDIETYQKAKSEASDVLSLTNNYRSSIPLLDTINCLYRNGLKESDLKYNILYPGTITNSYFYGDLNNIFEVFEFSNKKSNVEDKVIQYIVDFLSKNKEINPNKLSILTLYNFQCLELKEKLLNFNIPSTIINKINIFDTEASNLISIFINCLIRPGISRNINLLATSKFIEINPGDLIEPIIVNKIDELKSQCIKWSLELKEKGFMTLVNELIIFSKSSSILQDKDLNSNLFQLSEILENELIKNNFDLNNVFKWYKYQLDIYSRNCNSEDYIAKNYNINDGINISTIHNSKGLEFDIVLCPYLSFISKKTKQSKGPLWKSNLDRNLYINITSNYSKVEIYKLEEERDLLKECERLIYVSLTRAKYKLIIFKDIDSDETILNKNLLSNLDNTNQYRVINENDLEDINNQRPFKRFNIKNSNNYLWKINKLNDSEKFRKTSIEDVISFSSYSSWIRNGKNLDFNLNQYEDYEDNISIISEPINNNLSLDKKVSACLMNPNPLSDFPKGIIPGTCLHKIIERYDFQSDNSETLLILILEELESYGIDTSIASKVKEGILRIINVSLGKELHNKRLIDIPSKYILKEVKYDLPLSYNQKVVNASDISKCFLLDREFEFGEDYSKKINDLQILNKGFHSGCIDCLVPIGNSLEDSKWWVVDWKSNFISDTQSSNCIPQNYNYENMKEEMINHHYPLQAHLYLLALHRLLKWRLKNYQPNLHLGGYLYLFIKGLPDSELFKESIGNSLSPGVFIGKAPLNRINYLDKLF